MAIGAMFVSLGSLYVVLGSTTGQSLWFVSAMLFYIAALFSFLSER